MAEVSTGQWAARKQAGDDHERRICWELERRHWTVAPYGQGVLPDPIRRALGTTESLMRWDPDLVACKGSTLALVDGKCSMRGENAHTYMVSRKALRAHLKMWTERELPVYYVFSNLGVATPWEVLQFCGITSPGEAGGYVSFSAGAPRPFDDVFGAPSPVQWGEAA